MSNIMCMALQSTLGNSTWLSMQNWSCTSHLHNRRRITLTMHHSRWSTRGLIIQRTNTNSLSLRTRTTKNSMTGSWLQCRSMNKHMYNTIWTRQFWRTARRRGMYSMWLHKNTKSLLSTRQVRTTTSSMTNSTSTTRRS